MKRQSLYFTDCQIKFPFGKKKWWRGVGGMVILLERSLAKDGTHLRASRRVSHGKGQKQDKRLQKINTEVQNVIWNYYEHQQL